MSFGGYEYSGELEIGDQRSALADILEIFNIERKVRITRNRKNMQHGIGRATGCRYAGDRVLKCLPDKNVPRSSSVLQEIHYQLAAVKSNLIFLGIHGWNAVETHGRQSNHLHHRRHRVRCVLSAACSRTRACDIL